MKKTKSSQQISFAGPKSENIKQIFSSIAFNYDKANRFITLGMDSLWRKKLVAWSENASNRKSFGLCNRYGGFGFGVCCSLGTDSAHYRCGFL